MPYLRKFVFADINILGNSGTRTQLSLHLALMRSLKSRAAQVRSTDFMQAVTLVAGYTRSPLASPLGRRIEAAKQGWNLDKLPGVACDRAEVLKLTIIRISNMG